MWYFVQEPISLRVSRMRLPVHWRSILFFSDVFRGKVDRQDVYQAPYIWVQFPNPKPNTLINVLCRAYSRNIYYDKKAGRALTRFQIYVEDSSKFSKPKKSQKNGDM